MRSCAVGVAQREDARRRPAHELRRGVDDVALVGAVEVLHHRLHAVRGAHLHRHLAALEAARAGARQVRRLPVEQAVLVRREAVAGRHGVRPGDVAVPPDVDDRRAVEHRAGDVVHARDREVALREAVAPAPREVRVAEHHAAAGRRGVAAERGAVAAERRGRVLAQPGEQLGLRGQCERHVGEADRQARVGGRRRGGVRDLLDEDAGAGEQVGRVDAVVEVERLGAGDVRGAAARRVGDAGGAADAREVAVDARGVALDHRPHLRARAAQRVGEQALDDLAGAQVAEDGVDLQVARVERHLVAVAALRPEEERPLRAPRDEGVGQRAGGVLRGRPALPVAEARVVLRGDVRDAVRGARQRRARHPVGRAQRPRAGGAGLRLGGQPGHGDRRGEAAGEQQGGGTETVHGGLLGRMHPSFAAPAAVSCLTPGRAAPRARG